MIVTSVTNWLYIATVIATRDLRPVTPSGNLGLEAGWHLESTNPEVEGNSLTRIRGTITAMVERAIDVPRAPGTLKTLCGLDLAEALLATGRPEEIPAICHEVVALLTKAGLAAGAITALALLREAAAMGNASRDRVRRTHAMVKRVTREARPA